jgi:TctA family transporter
MMPGWVVVLLLLVASLAPVLTDNLSRFYAKAIRRLDKFVACTAVGAGYYLPLYGVRGYLDLCITFWTLYHIS